MFSLPVPPVREIVFLYINPREKTNGEDRLLFIHLYIYKIFYVNISMRYSNKSPKNMNLFRGNNIFT